MPAKPYRRVLCWVRRDLRLFDHGPLAEATAKADEVVVVFVFDRNILDGLQDRNDRRITFIHRALEELDREVWQRGGLLLVRIGRPEEEIPKLAQELGAEAVFAGRDYDPYAVARDAAIARKVTLELTKDVVIFEAGEVLTGDARPFRAYAPYRNAWMKRFDLQTGRGGTTARFHGPAPPEGTGAVRAPVGLRGTGLRGDRPLADGGRGGGTREAARLCEEPADLRGEPAMSPRRGGRAN